MNNKPERVPTEKEEEDEEKKSMTEPPICAEGGRRGVVDTPEHNPENHKYPEEETDAHNGDSFKGGTAAGIAAAIVASFF